MVVSLLAEQTRPVTPDGGRVSAGAVVALTAVGAAGADQTGTFAVDGFEEGTDAAVREIPASAMWGTATMPLRALGTAMTVAPIPSAAIRSTCQ